MSSPADRLTRLFALVPYLQNHQGIPIQKVADEFGVQPNQIFRDIDTLCVTGTADVHGSLIDFDYSALDEEGLIYIRDAEFLPRPLRLSRNEGIALVIGLRALREVADDAQTDVVNSALAKLEKAVGDVVQAPVDVHVERVDPTILATVRQAVTDAQRLEIDYATESRDERAARQVDPLRLFTANGFRYLEAWCLREQDVRMFRLDRMFGASLTGEAAEVREAEPRDLAADLFDSADAPTAIFDLESRAYWIAEYYQATQVEARGDLLRATIVGADWGWLVRLALRYADVAHIVEPAELADDVAAAAQAALSAYDGADGIEKG